VYATRPLSTWRASRINGTCLLRLCLYTILAIAILILYVEWQITGIGGNHILSNIDCNIQRRALNKVSSAKHSIA